MNEVQCKPQFDKQGVIGKNPKIIMHPSSFISHPRRYVHGLGISMRNEVKDNIRNLFEKGHNSQYTETCKCCAIS